MHTRYSEMMKSHGVSNEIRDLLASHEQAWREVIRDQKSSQAKALVQLQEKYTQELKLKEDQMNALKAQQAEDLQAVEAQLEYSYTLETMKLESEIKALRSGNLQAQGGLVEEMNALRLTHEEALRDQQRRHEAQLLEVTMRQETTLKRLEENMEKLSLALAADIEQDLLAHHEYQFMEEKLNHADAKTRMEARHMEVLDQEKTRHQEEISRLDMQHKKVFFGYIR